MAPVGQMANALFEVPPALPGPSRAPGGPWGPATSRGPPVTAWKARFHFSLFVPERYRTSVLASQGPMGSNPRGTRPGRGHSVEKSFFKKGFSRPPDRWFKRRRRAQFLVATNSSTLSDAARPPQCTLPPIARQVRARDRSVGARKGDCWPPQNVAAYLSI